MSNISNHKRAATYLTIVTFPKQMTADDPNGSLAGQQLGELITKGGQHGASYNGWIVQGNEVNAAFEGTLSEQQQAFVKSIGGTSTVTTPADWLAMRTRATSAPPQADGNWAAPAPSQQYE